MPRVFDYSSSGLTIRHPTTGATVFASSDRMLAQLGTKTFTGVAVDFPIVSGEVTEAGTGANFGFFRRNVPAVTLRTQTVTLGAHSGPVPDVIFGRCRVTSFSLGGLNIDEQFTPFDGITEWVSWPGGSIFLEFGLVFSTKARWLHRHLDIGVSGGNWILNKRQSNQGYITAFRSSAGTTESSFTMDFHISYGFLDL